MATLREQKEAFVTGLAGTTPVELLLICSTAPVGLWFFQCLDAGDHYSAAAAIEVIAFWIPMILCQSNWIYPWGAGYLAAEIVLAAILTLLQGKKHRRRAAEQVDTSTTTGRREALTVYRSSILYLTFVAILAVDFHIFPRRFVKTEVSGYSLMDLGAASAVVAAGLVSARARGKKQQDWLLNHISRMLPLIIMGLLRLVTHKGIEYQEHASEYGIHWNFFFTLAMLSPTAALLPGPGWLLPAVILAVYQYALSRYGLQEWVEDAPRSCSATDSFLCNMFVANREGVLGCIGYGVLYLSSEWIGYRFFWKQPSSSRYSLFIPAAMLLAVWRLAVFVGIDVSRRTTNAAFCIWALLINILQLAAIDFVYQHGSTAPPVLTAVNRHGLIVFVVANLLTGLVNLSINTLEVDDWTALFILLLYVSTIGVIAIMLDRLLPARRSTRTIETKRD